MAEHSEPTHLALPAPPVLVVGMRIDRTVRQPRWHLFAALSRTTALQTRQPRLTQRPRKHIGMPR
jgi:hypothetical protein